MKQEPSSRRRRSSTKSVLRLPDLEHAKAAVLNTRSDHLCIPFRCFLSLASTQQMQSGVIVRQR
jgi:hypothetical protein